MSNRLVVRLALALALASGAALAHSAFADPASSAQSSWIRSAQKGDPSLADPLAKRGREVFDARCVICHGDYQHDKSAGNSIYALPPMPGTLALELRYKGKKPALLEERTDLTPEAIAVFVRRGGGGVMPAFRPTEVSKEDLKALGAYLTRKR